MLREGPSPLLDTRPDTQLNAPHPDREGRISISTSDFSAGRNSFTHSLVNTLYFVACKNGSLERYVLAAVRDMCLEQSRRQRGQVVSMAAPATEHVRNIALVGQDGSGKTSLAEAMLFIAGETPRMGTTHDGKSYLDYDPEEIKQIGRAHV